MTAVMGRLVSQMSLSGLEYILPLIGHSSVLGKFGSILPLPSAVVFEPPGSAFKKENSAHELPAETRYKPRKLTMSIKFFVFFTFEILSFILNFYLLSFFKSTFFFFGKF